MRGLILAEILEAAPVIREAEAELQDWEDPHYGANGHNHGKIF